MSDTRQRLIQLIEEAGDKALSQHIPLTSEMIADHMLHGITLWGNEAHRCQFPGGVILKPDGVNELDPCIYENVERYANVTVTVSRCKVCGHVSIGWERQEDTVELEVE